MSYMILFYTVLWFSLCFYIGATIYSTLCIFTNGGCTLSDFGYKVATITMIALIVFGTFLALSESLLFIVLNVIKIIGVLL